MFIGRLEFVINGNGTFVSMIMAMRVLENAAERLY
ncbi:hypothetical protein SCG7109_AB_00040 [Chlamydiales bacterium SCGC AG-110-M15]|nr:hypothetical protein SCG7109_AB_00040 [Chlamydiales bacterium SCGC AG-110-M15]